MPARNKPSRQSRYHYRALPFSIRSEDVVPDGSHFRGYAAVHNNIDTYGTVMGRGCFDKDIAFFRSSGFIGGLNHNWDEPIGKPDEATPDAHGLMVGADIVDTAHGMDVRKLMKAGVIRRMSFGFEDVQKQFLDTPKEVAKYWGSVGYEPDDDDQRLSKGGALLFTRLKVYEASPVMAPGNDRAAITDVRKAAVDPADDATHPGEYTTFELMSLAVRDAVIDLCVRAEQLAELRAADGRSLSPERRAIIREIRDRADGALAACQPRATLADVAKLRRELLEIELSLL